MLIPLHPQAWAKVSGRYEGCPEDPAKWKTNFRCALRSTRMFVLLEDRSKCGDDPHKVFAINPSALWHGEEGDFSSPDPAEDEQPLHQQPQLELAPQNVAPEIASQGSPNSAQHPALEDLEVLQWVLQQCDISRHDLGPPAPSWVPAGDAPHQDALLQPHPDPSQNNCLPPSAFQQWVPAAEQSPLDAYSPPDPMLLVEQGGCCGAGSGPGDGNAMTGVGGFPSPAELADGKQRRFTEELLGSAGLQLEQRTCKLFATRLKKCKVFWALSQQLEGVGDPPPNLLCRDQETPIFDFNEFCTELRDFRNGQRQRSPDFTIYLCFGQSFSKAKPKESKLILVKLVPKFCEYWYEQVVREGASSLDSGTISLQLSDSFSLFELIEQCNMQLD
ncbi:interferon regulatory factor 7 [Egretta garzetta]|uniref:interferon regulatory factor 7 n=1 Tax=Egretta garzetta TaxID=188379 RepID=UPI00163BE0A4|nr:interferon regulatory factor 7 [Egretta garzetta]